MRRRTESFGSWHSASESRFVFSSDPKSFIWTASASDILAKVTRAKATLAAASRSAQNSTAHYTRGSLSNNMNTQPGRMW